MCMCMQNHRTMKRSTSLLFASALSIIAAAQQAPHETATIGRHLLEVNGQWKTMDPTMLGDEQLVAFNSEAERIADHLHRVAERLAVRPPKVIAWESIQRRRLLLDSLNAYADRGRFPMNDVVPGRSPVFIDKAGTACAVGQLMIASGDAELAQRIHNEMNLAYIHDIALPEVTAWASANGFTTDELAWIQPTYEFRRMRDHGLVASFLLANGDMIEVRGPANPEAPQKLRLLRKGATGSKVLATLPLLSGAQVMENEGHVFIGGMPPKNAPTAEVYEWNGRSLIKHDPFPGCMAIGSLNFVNGTLHVVGYELGNGEPQERYLSESGEWMTVETAIEVVPRIEVVPEE